MGISVGQVLIRYFSNKSIKANSLENKPALAKRGSATQGGKIKQRKLQKKVRIEEKTVIEDVPEVHPELGMIRLLIISFKD